MTEPSYFSRVERAFGVRLDVSGFGVDPLSLVRRAKQELRSQSRRTPDFDEIWCVFDVDEHENLQSAIVEARDAGIRVAVSNPCFELWIVLHVQEHSAWISRDNVQRLASALLLLDGKHVSEDCWGRLRAGIDFAMSRAEALRERHESNGSDRAANPSSGVSGLMGVVLEQSRHN